MGEVYQIFSYFLVLQNQIQNFIIYAFKRISYLELSFVGLKVKALNKYKRNNPFLFCSSFVDFTS